jgi:hypothetical protein
VPGEDFKALSDRLEEDLRDFIANSFMLTSVILRIGIHAHLRSLLCEKQRLEVL